MFSHGMLACIAVGSAASAIWYCIGTRATVIIANAKNSVAAILLKCCAVLLIGGDIIESAEKTRVAGDLKSIEELKVEVMTTVIVGKPPLLRLQSDEGHFGECCDFGKGGLTKSFVLAPTHRTLMHRGKVSVFSRCHSIISRATDFVLTAGNFT